MFLAVFKAGAGWRRMAVRLLLSPVLALCEERQGDTGLAAALLRRTANTTPHCRPAPLYHTHLTQAEREGLPSNHWTDKPATVMLFFTIIRNTYANATAVLHSCDNNNNINN